MLADAPPEAQRVCVAVRFDAVALTPKWGGRVREAVYAAEAPWAMGLYTEYLTLCGRSKNADQSPRHATMAYKHWI